MTVSTTYNLLQIGAGLVGTLDGEADAATSTIGNYIYAATDGTGIAGFAGQGNFSGGAGVDPAIALLTDGNIVIAGEDASGILFRIINQSGATVLSTVSGFDVSTSNADVAALTGGGFVIVCEDAFGGSDNDIDVRVYDNSGVSTATFAVDSSTADDRNAKVAALANGNFAVAWTRTIGAETEVWFGVYTPAGAVVAAAQLLDTVGTTNRNVSICATLSGFAVVYEDNGWNGDVDITLSRRSFTGDALGTTDVAQTATADEAPQVAMLPNGMLVVSYGDNSVGANLTDTVVKLVDPATGVVLASRTVAGGQNINHDVVNNALVTFGAGGIAALGSDLNLGVGAGQVTQDILVVERTSISNGDGDSITGDDLIDIMFGGGGIDFLNGAGGDDELFGGSENDSLNGGFGADYMEGGAGDDAYFVDEAGDTIFEMAGAGTDLVYSAVDYTLGADVENLTLIGLGDIDAIGNGLNNILVGNSGNNSLSGGLGADTMQGGLGDDHYSVDNVGDVVIEAADGGQDSLTTSVDFTLGANQSVESILMSDSADLTVFGNGLVNYIAGNTGHNTILGLGGDDTLFGNDGNDIIDGGIGADSMHGGIGDDGFIVDDIGDVLIEFDGQGTDVVASTISFSLQNLAIENLTLFGLAAVNGTGNGMSNILNGNNADNILDGAGGDDVMTGRQGNDTYVVDSVGDEVVELIGEGFDRVVSSIHYDLAGDVLEHLTLTGNQSLDGTGNTLDNHMIGNAGTNSLYGYDGADILDGGGGGDLLVGGIGDDTYYVDNANDIIVEDAGEGLDTVYAAFDFSLVSQAIENATATGDDSVDLTGNAGANILVGNASFNTIDGGAGADLMIGGDGADTYHVDNVGDVIVELAGEGIDLVHTSIDLSLDGTFIEDATLLGALNLSLVGNGLDNVLTGNAGANVLSGGSGADVLTGDDGDDILIGGAGQDVMLGGAGSDTVSFANGSGSVTANLATQTVANDGDGNSEAVSSIENLIGSAFADILSGSGIANTLDGGAGDDTLSGSTGDDILRGGVGVDTLNGGTEIDTADYARAAAGVTASLTLGSASNDGDGGSDTLTGIENLTGSAFNDVLTGSGANNVLVGGAGNDSLSGLNGDDILRGGAGVDVLNGGGGIDTVDYSLAAAGMKAQLNTNTSSNDGDGGTDTFSGIENLTGSNFNDTLIGDANANVLIGGLGADTLLGLDGNDLLWGGEGALNTLQGGLGDDTYRLQAGDSIVENVGEGIDTVDCRLNTYILANNVENLIFNGPGNFAGTGNALGNVMTGGAGADVLRGRGGVDVMNGGLGIDTADYTLAATGVVARIDLQRATNDGDGATDTYTGIENLIGSNFNDTLIGDNNANVLMGGIGTDTLLGFGGNDILMGGSGGGNNQLQGGQGDDYYVLDAFDTCVEFVGEGIDTVEARIGSYTMGANIENLLYTGPGGFTGNGNAMDNVITGGNQNDVLRGKGGNDIINGGLGADEVQFTGTKAQYTVSVEGDGYRIIDTVAARDGSTFVTSIEKLRFLTGNTTTNLTWPPVAPGALEPTDKASGEDFGGPLVSPLIGGPEVQPMADDDFLSPVDFDGPEVLPAVFDDAFPGDYDPALDGLLLALEANPMIIGSPHGPYLRYDENPDVAHRPGFDSWAWN